MLIHKKIKALLVVTLSIFCFALVSPSNASAENLDYGINMSPMNQVMVINPGQPYSGSFDISNPASHVANFSYKIEVKPFYVNENYDIHYNVDEGNFNQIVDWVTIDGPTEGILEPNTSRKVHFTINTPDNPPAGGQYAAIVVSSKMSEDDNNDSLNLKVGQAMAFIMYAEVAGTSDYSGEILNADVSGFIFSGKISGRSSIRNTGNIHTRAKYTLQVFPLFSDEEVYTNEEDPQTQLILPDRTLYNVTSWEDTPEIGIFNVVYTVEFNGITNQIKKVAIICPLWLLILVVIVIVVIGCFVVFFKKKKHN